MTQRILTVFGGSFDPWGRNHQHAVDWLRANVPGEVMVVPSYAHAFKTNGTPYRHRLAMVRLGVCHSRPDRIWASGIELAMSITHKGAIRTYELLQAVQRRHQEHRVQFAIGDDLVPSLPRWEKVPEIRRDFGLVVVPAGGGTHATTLRAMIAAGDPGWSDLVVPPVAQYIRDHGLYRRWLDLPPGLR